MLGRSWSLVRTSTSRPKGVAGPSWKDRWAWIGFWFIPCSRRLVSDTESQVQSNEPNERFELAKMNVQRPEQEQFNLEQLRSWTEYLARLRWRGKRGMIGVGSRSEAVLLVANQHIWIFPTPQFRFCTIVQQPTLLRWSTISRFPDSFPACTRSWAKKHP